MTTYSQCEIASKKYRERNDCTVKAIAIAAGIPYDCAYSLLKSFGRRPRRGYKLQLHLSGILSRLGLAVHQRDYLIPAIKRKGSGLTMMTVSDYLPKRGVFLLWTARHVACYRGGRVHDWTVGRKHRITNITKIVPA